MPIYCKFCGATNISTDDACHRCGRSFYGTHKVMEKLPNTVKVITESTDVARSVDNTITADNDYHLKSNIVLNGIYRIRGVLGEGGFGITYIAENERTGEKVAIKEFYCKELIHRNVYENTDVTITYQANTEAFTKAKERFLKEAKTLIKFRDASGIVRIQDYFEENKTAYIVMNYLRGVTLKAYIKQYGTISWKDVVNMIIPVMDTLDEIHETGLIHRDISSSNIMLLEDKSLALLDFGSAKMLLQEESYTNTSIFAKKGYTPIEQYSDNGHVGPWTDVYAITAVIYECITGVLPPDSLQRVVYDEYESVKSKGINVPKELELICEKGLAVKSLNRYQSVSEISNALRELIVSKTDKREKIVSGIILGIVMILIVLLNYL